MVMWTVSIAVLRGDQTWFTQDWNCEAVTQQEAEDLSLEQGRAWSDVGMACIAGIWEQEENDA